MSEDDAPSPALVRVAGAMMAGLGGLGLASVPLALAFDVPVGNGGVCATLLWLYVVAPGFVAWGIALARGAADRQVLRAATLFAASVGLAAAGTLALSVRTREPAWLVGSFAPPCFVAAGLALAGRRDYLAWRAGLKLGHGDGR